jgi:hypothetical protein
MRRLALACSLLTGALLLTGFAGADTGHVDAFAPTDLTFPALNALASHWARRPVVVECASSWESWNADSDAEGSWGYTWLDADWTRVEPGLCQAALEASSPDLSAERAWFVAIAVHVITHESWHLRQWDLRASEARVECNAIKSDRRSFLLLGASPEQADDLYSWAWAFHVREGSLFPAYAYQYCHERTP